MQVKVSAFKQKMRMGKQNHRIWQISLSTLLVVYTFIANSVYIYAQSVATEVETLVTDAQVSGTDPVTDMVSNIATVSLSVAGAFLFILGLLGGYKVLISAGDPEKLMEGKEILTNALLGFLVVALAVSILTVLNNALGLHIGVF